MLACGPRCLGVEYTMEEVDVLTFLFQVPSSDLGIKMSTSSVLLWTERLDEDLLNRERTGHTSHNVNAMYLKLLTLHDYGRLFF